VQNLNSEITNLTLGPASDPKIGAALAQKREQLRHAETKLDELSPFRSLSMYLLFVLSTKIAAIVFLVFLVQLLGNIYRYLTRLAFSLDSRADVLEFAETTPNTAMLIAMFLPEKSVEMDQMPAFPVLDQLKGAPKTLGGRG
jgi:hypothetical protein